MGEPRDAVAGVAGMLGVPVTVQWTDPEVYAMQAMAGMHDMVECRHCGWMGERMEIGTRGHGDSACGYFKVRVWEHWCPSCGVDWNGRNPQTAPTWYVYS